MQTIPNVATADNYSAACTLEDINAVAGSYVVANAAVVAKFRPKRKDGTLAPYGPELLLPPQSNNVVGCAGMAFRSANPGVPAQVIAVLYDADDALPGAPTPFSQTISSSGSVTPGVAAVQIQKDGALVGSESILNLLTGLGIKLTATDDVANTRVNVTIDQAAIARSLLAAPAASVDVQNIPATYAALEVIAAAWPQGGGTDFLAARFNNDTTNSYVHSVVSFLGTGPFWTGNDGITSRVELGLCGSLTPGVVQALLPSYKQAVIQAVKGTGAAPLNTGPGQSYYNIASGFWNVAAAINRITFLIDGGTNLGAGTDIVLRGVAGT